MTLPSSSQAATAALSTVSDGQSSSHCLVSSRECAPYVQTRARARRDNETKTIRSSHIELSKCDIDHTCKTSASPFGRNNIRYSVKKPQDDEESQLKPVLSTEFGYQLVEVGHDVLLTVETAFLNKADGLPGDFKVFGRSGRD